MSPLAAGSRRFSASALRVTLLNPDLRRHNAKETIPPVKKNRKSHRFSDLCSLSIRFRGKRKKTKERTKSKKTKGISGNETRRKRGRPRKIRNPSDVDINEENEVSDFSFTSEASVGYFQSVDKTCSNLGKESRYDASGVSMDSNLGKRKRGRPPKGRDGFNQPAVKCKREDKEEPVNLENREGIMVDLSALANISEDPYGEELRRITVGLETKEAVLGFLEQLNGEWVNTGKKKKVVKACDYGGYLPRGWKLILCIKKKGSNVWLACRTYISPDGQQFATCKEVSIYLQSLLESQSKNRVISLQSDDNETLGQPVMANETILGNSDSMDLTVLGSETKQNIESRSISGEVYGEAKGAENGNGNVAVPVKTNVMEEDDKGIPAAECMNEDNDMKKTDDNMENLEVRNGENVMKMIQGLSTATGEVL